MEDDDFLAQITFSDLKKRYSEEIHSITRKANSDFRDTVDARVAELNRGIETQKEHDKVLNLSIHPFIEKSSPAAKLGYVFVRAAPLFERDVKNLDFLIYRREGKKPIAIFGEAKSSITNYNKVLTEFDERKKVVEDNLEYVKSQYLKTTADPILEYVLVVKSSIASDTRDAALERSMNLVLWQADPYEIRLKLMTPPPGIDPTTSIKWVHHDANLNSVLGKSIPSNAAALAFFPQSHTVTKMKALLQCMRVEEHNLTVPLSLLESYLSEQMGYLDSGERAKEAGFIIREAERIGFVAESTNKPELAIISGRRKPSSLEEEIQNRWIQSKLDEERKSAIDQAKDIFQREILSEQKKRPTLD